MHLEDLLPKQYNHPELHSYIYCLRSRNFYAEAIAPIMPLGHSPPVGRSPELREYPSAPCVAASQPAIAGDNQPDDDITVCSDAEALAEKQEQQGATGEVLEKAHGVRLATITAGREGAAHLLGKLAGTHSAAVVPDAAWVDYFSDDVYDKDVTKKDITWTAAWISEKLRLACPRGAIWFDLADIHKGERWNKLWYKRRALIRLAIESVQVHMQCGWRSSMATPVHMQAQAPEVAPAESCAEGLAAAAALAKRAVYETASRLTASGVTPQAASALNRAQELLSPPVVTRRIAQAYDDIRAMCKDLPLDCEETGKVAALAVREALVLQICCTAGSLRDVGFKYALEQAFGRQPRPEVRSQLHLTRAAICRLGRDRDNFMRSAPKIFNGALGDQEMTELYQAYANCADGLKMASASGGGCRG